MAAVMAGWCALDGDRRRATHAQRHPAPATQLFLVITAAVQ